MRQSLFICLQIIFNSWIVVVCRVPEHFTSSVKKLSYLAPHLIQPHIFPFPGESLDRGVSQASHLKACHLSKWRNTEALPFQFILPPLFCRLIWLGSDGTSPSGNWGWEVVSLYLEKQIMLSVIRLAISQSRGRGVLAGPNDIFGGVVVPIPIEMDFSFMP